MSGRPDVVFLTIDCWRYDAVTQMHRLRAMASESLDRTEAICQSAATPGVFPAILASDYYSSAYDATGALRDELTTLPTVLANAGYETGAIVANNPFLEKFRNEFDFFWNGGSGKKEYRRVYEYAKRKFRRHGCHRPAVPAPAVRTKAADWFRCTDGPRFLLMHLMDPHEPYYPGLWRWLRVGPLRARRALAQFHADRLSMTRDQQATVERLYWQCVEFVDAHVRSLLSFVPEDALVVVMADHGEEFEHGAYRHARLYDECVRVPLFVRNLPEVAATDLVRQLDIAPSILSRLGLSVPDTWAGAPCDGTVRDSFMLNHSPQWGESYLGVRTERYKFIQTRDTEGGGTVRTELYDLATDPRETRDLAETEPGAARADRLSERLTAFVDENDVEAGIDRGTGSHPESGAPEERLEALGYV